MRIFKYYHNPLRKLPLHSHQCTPRGSYPLLCNHPLTCYPRFPDWRRCWALALSLAVSGTRMTLMTRAARVEDKGQPWLTPSCMDFMCHLTSFILKTQSLTLCRACGYGGGLGYLWLTSSKVFSCESSLNMFLWLRATKQQDGELHCICLLVVYFLTESWDAFTTKSIPVVWGNRKEKGGLPRLLADRQERK